MSTLPEGQVQVVPTGVGGVRLAPKRRPADARDRDARGESDS